jgi:hypothetical protein
MTKFQVGDKVKFNKKKLYGYYSKFYPPYGTIGFIKETENDGCWVQWPDDTTALDGKWWVRYEYLRLAEQ